MPGVNSRSELQKLRTLTLARDHARDEFEVSRYRARIKLVAVFDDLLIEFSQISFGGTIEVAVVCGAIRPPRCDRHGEIARPLDAPLEWQDNAIGVPRSHAGLPIEHVF